MEDFAHKIMEEVRKMERQSQKVRIEPEEWIELPPIPVDSEE